MLNKILIQICAWVKQLVTDGNNFLFIEHILIKLDDNIDKTMIIKMHKICACDYSINWIFHLNRNLKKKKRLTTTILAKSCYANPGWLTNFITDVSMYEMEVSKNSFILIQIQILFFKMKIIFYLLIMMPFMTTKILYSDLWYLCHFKNILQDGKIYDNIVINKRVIS